MGLLEQYKELKDKADKAQQNHNKAEGALDQIKRQLKEDFGCSSLKDAKNKLKMLTKEVAEAEKDLQNAMDEFESEWEDELSSDEE